MGTLVGIVFRCRRLRKAVSRGFGWAVTGFGVRDLLDADRCARDFAGCRSVSGFRGQRRSGVDTGLFAPKSYSVDRYTGGSHWLADSRRLSGAAAWRRWARRFGVPAVGRSWPFHGAIRFRRLHSAVAAVALAGCAGGAYGIRRLIGHRRQTLRQNIGRAHAVPRFRSRLR